MVELIFARETVRIQVIPILAKNNALLKRGTKLFRNGISLGEVRQGTHLTSRREMDALSNRTTGSSRNRSQL